MMIRLFDKGLSSEDKQLISDMATDDIKANKLKYGKMTTLPYVKQVVQTSQIVLERCNGKGS